MPVPKTEMTFSDRRIINAKLEEVYADELTGYREEWSDERVAVELGTQTAWVAELRAANFGPAEGNALVAELKREHAELSARMDRFQTEGAALTQALNALGERIKGVAR